MLYLLFSHSGREATHYSFTPGTGHASLCSSSRSFHMLPSWLWVCHCGLCSSLPSATCYTWVTHTNTPRFLSGQRNSNNHPSDLDWNWHKQRSDNTRESDLFRQHKHSWRGLCPPTPLPWLVWLAGQGAEQLLQVLHVRYHLQQHHGCSPTRSASGSSRRDHHIPQNIACTSLIQRWKYQGPQKKKGMEEKSAEHIKMSSHF